MVIFTRSHQVCFVPVGMCMLCMGVQVGESAIVREVGVCERQWLLARQGTIGFSFLCGK